jgi:helix-turn-helix protein
MKRGPRRLFEVLSRFIARYGPWGCFLSQAKLKALLKTSLRSIQRWTAALIKAGYIEMRRRSQTTALYNLGAKVAGQVAGQVAGHYKDELRITPTEFKRAAIERKPPRRSSCLRQGDVSVDRPSQDRFVSREVQETMEEWIARHEQRRA